jgi:hypothetical protein
MSKNNVLTLGVGFSLLGFLGYLTSLVPAADEKALLLGQFSNSSVQTALYLATGLTALWCVKMAKDKKAVGHWIQVAGVVYTLLTVVSVVEKGAVLGLFKVNGADTLLFFVVAVMALTHSLSDGKDA